MKYRHETRGTVITVDGVPPGPGWVPAKETPAPAPKKSAPKKSAAKPAEPKE